jgi:N-acetylmuramoyl-L-alanine amidase
MLALLAAAALAVPGFQAADPLRPPIVQRPIPFGAQRRAETAAYARRHYGLSTFRLRDPHVIVEHLTVTSSIDATYDTFAPDRPDVELHELPGVCSHFVVGRDGTIVQFVALSIMCRHTVGLNWTAFGIEHVGSRDADVLGNRRQLSASLALTRWLRCRYAIKVRDVIGHNESLSSPYHRERVARLRRQTHGDWATASMRRYRARLRALPCSAPAPAASSAASSRARDTSR